MKLDSEIEEMNELNVKIEMIILKLWHTDIALRQYVQINML